MKNIPKGYKRHRVYPVLVPESAGDVFSTTNSPPLDINTHRPITTAQLMDMVRKRRQAQTRDPKR